MSFLLVEIERNNGYIFGIVVTYINGNKREFIELFVYIDMIRTLPVVFNVCYLKLFAVKLTDELEFFAKRFRHTHLRTFQQMICTC